MLRAYNQRSGPLLLHQWNGRLLMEIAPGIHQFWGLGCRVFALVDETVTLIDAGAPAIGLS